MCSSTRWTSALFPARSASIRKRAFLLVVAA
jgi:hypothetical protein